MQTANEQLKSNIRHALTMPFLFVEAPLPAGAGRDLVIVGGGASAGGFIGELKWHREQGREIWALNGAFGGLVENGIEPQGHVMSGAGPEYAALVPEKTEATLFYASQCHPDTLARAARAAPRTIVWHPQLRGIGEVLGGKRVVLIGVGATVGLSAINLAYTLGCRTLYLYGFDSSYRAGQNMPQGARAVKIEIGGRQFDTTLELAQQVNEFEKMLPGLADLGCKIAVQGDGLLPWVAQRMLEGKAGDRLMRIDGLWWPAQDTECRWSVGKFIGDVEPILKFCRRRNVAVQAGGNVGAWPLEFARHFARVVTFEPDALNYECLSRNVGGNAAIEPHRKGLGDRREKVELERDPSNCGAHFVKGEGDIEIVPLDELDLDVCDLIQLDVEGYEYKALAGSLQTIRRCKPVIVTEEKRLGERYGVRDEEILRLLVPLGYKIVHKMNRDVIYSAEEP